MMVPVYQVGKIPVAEFPHQRVKSRGLPGKRGTQKAEPGGVGFLRSKKWPAALPPCCIYDRQRGTGQGNEGRQAGAGDMCGGKPLLNII